MKTLNIILIIAFAGLMIFLIPKSCEKIELIENIEQLHKLDSLKLENSKLSDLNDSLSNSYVNVLEIKDSVVIRLKTKYITIFDTITNDTIECLPKIHVDSLILTYENVVSSADTLISIQKLQINNLEQQNSIQDTIIVNYQTNESTLKKEIKKQKRSKWLFGGIGAAIGYVAGKLF